MKFAINYAFGYIFFQPIKNFFGPQQLLLFDLPRRYERFIHRINKRKVDKIFKKKLKMIKMLKYVENVEHDSE